MKNVTRHTGKLEIRKRMPSSKNGNPRYCLRVDGYNFLTQVDAMVAYSVKNYEGKEVEVTIGRHYGVLSLNTIRAL